MTYDEHYNTTIIEALNAAKEVQDFLWGSDQSIYVEAFDASRWVPLFEKRVSKIREISPANKHWKVELRKRLLQQAALSIRAMIALEANTEDEILTTGGRNNGRNG